MRVAFVNPDPPGSPFWSHVTAFMQVVAEDLDIQLDIYYGDRGRLVTRDNFLQALEGKEKPDYLITILHENIGDTLMAAAQASGVKVFIINTDVPKSLKKTLGKPREKFSSWIGHMYPDDIQGGYDLLVTLAAGAGTLPKSAGPPFRLIGITGSRESSPGIYRKNGAEVALTKTSDILTEQMLYAYWSRQKAATATRGLLNRYPQTSMIWCAGGDMTFGILDALRHKNLIPGKDILLGTFDWTDAIIARVKAGEIFVSAGGHFLEGGWALILLYDHYHGMDFKSKTGLTIRTPMILLTHENVHRYEPLITGISWHKTDFKLLTRTHGGRQSAYNLSINALSFPEK